MNNHDIRNIKNNSKDWPYLSSNPIVALFIEVPVYLFIIFPLMWVVEGMIASLLWNWYLVPIGLPEIRVINCVGLAMLIQLLTAKPNKSEKKIAEIINLNLALYGMMFAYGWLFHFFL